MSKYIIFYRHAMAEDKENVESDEERSLSLRGKNLLKKSVEGFDKMLASHNNVKLYSSPTTRAKETAEMLSKDLELPEPEYLDFLETGGSVVLIRDLVDKLGSGDTAIIVGQQPYLSLWSQEISGTFLRFKKGTAACFKFPDKEGGEEKAELRWYLQTRDFVEISDK